MGRNGIFCNLVYRVKIIRNRFFENVIYFFVLKKDLYFFFCFLSIIYLKIISGGLFFCFRSIQSESMGDNFGE